MNNCTTEYLAFGKTACRLMCGKNGYEWTNSLYNFRAMCQNIRQIFAVVLFRIPFNFKAIYDT